MTTEKNYILRKFNSDKFDVHKVSKLSLFLYEQLFVIIAHPENSRDIIGVHLYTLNSKTDVPEILSTDALINASNATGRLTVHHKKFGLVPSILFNPSHAGLYLNFSTELSEGNWEVNYEGVSNNNIQVVSAIDKHILDSLDKLLPELEVSHGAAQVLDYMLHHAVDLLHQEIFIQIVPGSFYLAGFKGGDLMIFNRFDAQENTDFIKYVLTVIQQLAFDRMHCKISVFGNLDFIHCNLEMLKSYFKNIQLLDPEQNVKYHSGAEKFKNTKLLEAFWTPNNH